MFRITTVIVLSMGASLVSAQTLTNEPANPKFGVVKEKVSATPTPTPITTPTPKQTPVVKSKATVNKPKPATPRPSTPVPARRPVTAPAATPTPTPVVQLDVNQKLDSTTTIGDALRSASKSTKVVEEEELTKISAAMRTNSARLQEELSMLWKVILLGFAVNILAVMGFIWFLVRKKKEQADVRHASEIHREEDTHPEVWIAAVLTGMSWFATPAHAQTALPTPPPTVSMEALTPMSESSCSITGVLAGGSSGVVYQGDDWVKTQILLENCVNPTDIAIGDGIEFRILNFEENVLTVEVKADFSSKIGKLEFVVLEDGKTPVASGTCSECPFMLVYNRGLAALREELMEKHAKDVAALDTKIMLLGQQFAELKFRTTNRDGRLARLVQDLGNRSICKPGIKCMFGGREPLDWKVAELADEIAWELDTNPDKKPRKKPQNNRKR